MRIPSIAAIALTSLVPSAPAIPQDKSEAPSGMHGSQSAQGQMIHGSMQPSSMHRRLNMTINFSIPRQLTIRAR